MIYWILKHLIIGPLLKTVYRPWVEGAENLPASGPVIIVGNHLSVIDSFFMPLMVDRRVSFLAKSDYFTGKGLKGWFVKTFMLSIGQIPIDRSGGKASEASLNTGLAVLDRGVLQQCDAPEVLYRQPATEFVARFIGDPPMSIFDGTIADQTLTLSATESPIRLPLLPEIAGRFAEGPVRVGFRPEALRVDSPGELTADVERVERLLGNGEREIAGGADGKCGWRDVDKRGARLEDWLLSLDVDRGERDQDE